MVQFYPWLKFYLHYHTPNQREIKSKTRIKLNHNIVTDIYRVTSYGEYEVFFFLEQLKPSHNKVKKDKLSATVNPRRLMLCRRMLLME